MIASADLLRFFAQYEDVEPDFTARIFTQGNTEARHYFTRLVKALLREFYPGYQEDYSFPDPTPVTSGAYLYQNPKALNKRIPGVRILTVHSLYPTVIGQLIGENKLRCNVPVLLEVYAAAIAHIEVLLEGLTDIARRHYRSFLNMFYGMTQNLNSVFRVSCLEHVALRVRHIWEEFLVAHGPHTAHIRVDTAYLRGATVGHKAELEAFFEQAGLRMTVERGVEAIFFDCDRHIVQTEHETKYHRLFDWK